MSDMIDNGLDWAKEQLFIYAARPIVYIRGNNRIETKAVIGRTLLKLSDEFNGIKIEWTDRDFLIRAEDLIINGESITPERGDIILEQFDNKTYHYEVLSIGGEPEWRWSDPYHKIFRIHTKLMEIEYE